MNKDEILRKAVSKKKMKELFTRSIQGDDMTLLA